MPGACKKASAVNVNDQGAAIVRSVLGLGRALDLVVLAEGVETAAELDFLRNEACNEAQGFLLRRPAEIETLQRLTEGAEEFDEPSRIISLAAKAASI